MKLFDDFLSKYPPAGTLRKPSAEVVKRFRDILPGELLDFWQAYGFGNYGGGLLKVVDPTDYMDSLHTWLGGKNPTRLPILITAFGNIFYYRKLSETEDDVCMLDIHYRKTITCTYSFQEFFKGFITNHETEVRLLYKELFGQAVKVNGIPEEKEIFYFVPALAYGGSETADRIQKGDAVTHQYLLFEMNAGSSGKEEEDDLWSQAYEAKPSIFESQDGSLFANFTLMETTDTILPTSPETRYKVEGKTIGLWVLTFFSLTQDEPLDMLEYHEALERLQPYIVENRGEAVLVRGLNLEEMEAVLAEK